jgi:hypothetical protein
MRKITTQEVAEVLAGASIVFNSRYATNAAAYHEMMAMYHALPPYPDDLDVCTVLKKALCT